MTRIETAWRFMVQHPPDLTRFVPQVIMQGYFLNSDGYVVRVRRVFKTASEGEEYGSLTVKGRGTVSGPERRRR